MPGSVGSLTGGHSVHPGDAVASMAFLSSSPTRRRIWNRKLVSFFAAKRVPNSVIDIDPSQGKFSSLSRFEFFDSTRTGGFAPGRGTRRPVLHGRVVRAPATGGMEGCGRGNRFRRKVPARPARGENLDCAAQRIPTEREHFNTSKHVPRRLHRGRFTILYA